MRRFGVGAVAAFAIAGSALPAILPVITPTAQALQGFSPNAPFIKSAGIEGAKGDSHFITVGVEVFPVSAFVIECTNLAGVEKATVTTASGAKLAASSSVSASPEGGTALTVTLAEPIVPGTTITVVMDGVDRNEAGGAMFYRVSALNDNIPYPFPVGTAMLLERSLGDR